jgi:CTP synthase
MRPKYIFITGGVLSALGKGIAAASIGALLESRGLRITYQKLDPYINVDPGTMNPFQHGEVFVTDDGSETDLDLGHYERFTDTLMGSKNNLTTGQVYHAVISKERKGEYLGRTVQVIPHITDEIKATIRAAVDGFDLIIVEIGGTVGDIEGLPFLEAIRQFRNEVGKENAIFIHLTWVPFLKTAGEVKTKPTQHSVKALREIGIQPDILLCRTDDFLSREIKEKIALFCNVEVQSVFSAKDVECIYEVPLVFRNEGLDERIVLLLNIWTGQPRLEEWEILVRKIKAPPRTACIGIVGKYVNLTDSYKSLNEALVHGGIANDSGVHLRFIDSEKIEKEGLRNQFDGVDGVIVPGGFGNRGIEGMISTIEYVRTCGIPYLGICLGMQLAVIEFARHVCQMPGANSSEFDPETQFPVIHLLEEQIHVTHKGASMRLGAYPCVLEEPSLAFDAYCIRQISERHRHRYEFNNDFRQGMTEKGLHITGKSPNGTLVEIIEVDGHPWFVGCQFHPEYKSTPRRPHPLFSNLIKASIKYRDG